MSPEQRIRARFLASAEAQRTAADHLAGPIARAGTLMAQTLARGGKVLSCGNGGSAADAQHFASELVNRFEQDRLGLRALALTTDTATLTSIANDDSYDQVFSRQVQVLGCEGDLLLALSTSGNSPNVNAAAAAARDRGIGVVALTGRDGGALASSLTSQDVAICVPGEATALIQEVHIVVIHCLCDLIDQSVLADPR